MRRVVLCLAVIPALLGAADSYLPFTVRGHAQSVARIAPAGDARAAVVFLAGDGGWRGAAVAMSKAIASWGYEVYGFDTKKYLEGFSQDGLRLTRDDMAADIRALADSVSAASRKPVVLVGWSQGAGMAVAATAGSSARKSIRGVITLGLPETAALGWDWKATLAAIARREPDQPNFATLPLLTSASQAPLWMIYGGADEYTSQETARKLYASAAQPKKFEQIPGANHRFDGHLDQLYRSIREALQWVFTV
jgi:type IV secretory pathway VirJ component